MCGGIVHASSRQISMNSHSVAPATQERSASRLNATLIKSVPLSAGAHHLTFRVDSRETLKFLPGQSICLDVPIAGSFMPAPYSIASAPREDNCFEICIRRGGEGSAAAKLCELNEGVQVRSTQPKGGFVLKELSANTVFLAAGTGIAPIRSMLHWLLRKENGRGVSRLCLVFGARERESLFFHEEFLQLARQNPNFHYLPTLSRCKSDWNGARGYVQDHLHLLPLKPQTTHAYLCGPAAMINSVCNTLANQGWPEDRIHFERYE